jgi:hypothetical protein
MYTVMYTVFTVYIYIYTYTDHIYIPILQFVDIQVAVPMLHPGPSSFVGVHGIAGRVCAWSPAHCIGVYLLSTHVCNII